MSRKNLVVAIAAMVCVGGACSGEAEVSSEPSNTTEAAGTSELSTTVVSTSLPDSASESSDAPTMSMITGDPVPTFVGPPAPAAPTTTPSPDADQVRSVEWVADQPPGDDGWVLSAGSWYSSAFEPTLRFVTGEDFVLVEQSPEAIELALPGSIKSSGLTILVPSAIASDDNLPTAPEGADLEEYLGASEFVDVERIEWVSPGSGIELQYADFSVSAPPEYGSFPCRLGPECIWIYRSAEGGDIEARDGAMIRVVVRDVGGVPIRVMATANDREQFESLAVEALAIASTLSAASDAPQAPSSVGLLSMVGSRLDHVPAGRHAATLGDVVLLFELDERLDGFELNYVDRDSIEFRFDDVGFLGFIRPWGYADPGVPQANAAPHPDQLLERPLETVDEVEEWIAAFETINERFERTIGGARAFAWDNTPNSDAPSYECGPPLQDPEQFEAGERCTNSWVTDIGWWFTATDGDRPDPVSSHGRSYLIDGTGVIVNIYVPDPMPIDEIEAAVEPLLDAMTFVVADERGDIESDTGS